jgi:hypothetical protein
MISPTTRGSSLNLIFLAGREFGEGWLKIIVALSMQYYGFCVLEHPGVICLQTTAIGRIHTGVFAVGATKAYGRTCLRFLSMSPTLNGL